jgi:hypothetical protein
MDYSTAPDNAVGAPYILMEYIHGSVASELRQAKSCNLQMFGTPEQGRKFREQMAQIQATVASFRFPKIGSLYHDPDTDEFYIGPELQTGRGPWASSTEYYDDLVDHLLKLASTSDEFKQSQSFMLPSILGHLMRIHGEERSGPFRLTNRDFGAHNILVNDNFDVVGVIDFDGVMAAPLETVAQYPILSFLDVDPPGVVYTVPAAVERVKRTAPRLQHYKELLARFEREMDGQELKVGEKMRSTSASVYRGIQAYAQHQCSVNERWMKACLKMALDFAQSG